MLVDYGHTDDEDGRSWFVRESTLFSNGAGGGKPRRSLLASSLKSQASGLRVQG